MAPTLFAFIVPAVMVAFACAFLVAARWVGRVAVYWAIGLLCAAAGFIAPIVPLPPVVLATCANALFLGAALAYGHALLLQFGRPTQLVPRVVAAAIAYLAIVIAIFGGDLQGELMLSDLAWSLLLGWAIIRALPHAHTPLRWALVAVMSVMTLEALIRVLAISWLVTAGSGPEDYFASSYAVFAQGTAGLIVTVFCLVAMGNLIERVLIGFRSDAEHDPLTGLLNRRGLDRAAIRLDPNKFPVTVIQCDLDYFKDINDTHGHAIGDLVLQRVAKLIVQLVPSNAAVCRFGGEEFVIVLDDTRLNDGGMLAHRLRLALGGVQWQELGVERQLTASFGVAQWSPSDHALTDALGRADAALYMAKEGGRNQVFLETHRPFRPQSPRVTRTNKAASS